MKKFFYIIIPICILVLILSFILYSLQDDKEVSYNETNDIIKQNFDDEMENIVEQNISNNIMIPTENVVNTENIVIPQENGELEEITKSEDVIEKENVTVKTEEIKNENNNSNSGSEKVSAEKPKENITSEKAITTNKDSSETSNKSEEKIETKVEENIKEEPKVEKKPVESEEIKVEVKEEKIEKEETSQIERCTTADNHGMGVGNSGKWFTTKDEAIAYYKSQIEYWGEWWQNADPDDAEADATYYKNCPSGYQVWSCMYCSKWTLDFYYR